MLVQNDWKIHKKEKAEKANIDLNQKIMDMQEKRNPVGKRFEGIVRFITPVFKNNEKWDISL